MSTSKQVTDSQSRNVSGWIKDARVSLDPRNSLSFMHTLITSKQVTGTLELCKEFVSTLNENPWNIRLTSHYSQAEIDFLDLKLQTPTKTYFNCRSRNLIYALVCPCPKVYVGQTTQELRRRIQQHFSNISTAQRDKSKGKTLTSVAAHYLVEHNSQWVGTKILGLEAVNTNMRGGNVTLELLKRESKWIFDLNCVIPLGINEDLLFTGFYKQ
ncbi:uncharacterized protein LOC143766764 [Ranitomeya variabilis]|uniref:uncharacterized protein LOC143766764 n=1 Tax=Ranitomeya variabilis TaxID=490064 RepID=UPI004056FA48